MTGASAWRELSADALRHNAGVVREASGAARTIAVVKADAYGHGAVAVARALDREPGVDFAVGNLTEAEQLRGAGISSQVLVFCGGAEPGRDTVRALRSLRLVPVLTSLEHVRVVCAAEAALPEVEVMVDTGMRREGLAPEELEPALTLLGSAGVDVRALATHLAQSEDVAGARTMEQIRRFARLLETALVRFPQVGAHLANSAASLHPPAIGSALASAFPRGCEVLRDPARMSVRVGGALYGIDLATYPGGSLVAGTEEETNSVEMLGRLRPALGVKAELTQVRHVGEGVHIGYAGAHVTARPSRLGLAPLGYADGVPQNFQGAHALVGGQRAPVVGRVSMDLAVLDLTGLALEESEPRAGTSATFLGRDGNREVTLHDWSAWSGRMPYELVCGLSRRLALRVR